jgi:toxin-antitoxin system, toxin component, hipA family
MKKLFVYADFDWLDAPQLIGELSCDSMRGSEIYGFSFDNNWLAKYGDIFLSEDLQNYTGMQYTRPEHDIFACFSDALPDRWGSTLLNRQEQIFVYHHWPMSENLCMQHRRLRQAKKNTCYRLKMAHTITASGHFTWWRKA